MLREQIKKDVVLVIRGQSLEISEEQVEVTRTSDPKFGDYTTNIALKATQNAKRLTTNAPKNYQSPLDFAKILADSLKSLPYVEKLEVAGPGFINFFIKSEVWQKQVEEVLKAGDAFGSNSSGRGKKARVEFVSANPTGPLHFGNARGGPIGDALASVLEFCSYQVLREYLNNDVGGQVDKLGATIFALLYPDKEQAKVEKWYQGSYISDLVSKVDKVMRDKIGVYEQLSYDQFVFEAGRIAVEIMFDEIVTDLKDMGISFDLVVNESHLRTKAESVINELVHKSFIKQKEGAQWFAPNDDFLKDRETVVKKSDGQFTYFAADIVYHKQKFESKPDLVVDIFGSNHHGHIPRLQAVVKALGFDVNKLKFILYQYVRFKRGGEIVKMSKRAGTFITVREVLDEVGRDALRFFILMHDPNTHIDFDLELAKKKSQENPVYYVQYAHARISSILAKLETRDLKLETDYRLLTTNWELDLIKQIARLPELVEDIAASFAVHRLTGYAVDLADSFHKFYENCRVIGEQKNLTQARMALILATKTALINTFRLLGISAPEKM